MKKFIWAFALLGLFAMSCGNNSEAKQQEEALKEEIIELDSLNESLQNTIEGINEAEAELDAALDAILEEE